MVKQVISLKQLSCYHDYVFPVTVLYVAYEIGLHDKEESRNQEKKIGSSLSTVCSF